MTTLCVHLHQAMSPGLDVTSAARRLAAAGERLCLDVEVVEGDGGEDVVVAMRGEPLLEAWAAVREELAGDAVLAAGAVVALLGDRGWEEARLLHHGDPREAAWVEAWPPVEPLSAVASRAEGRWQPDGRPTTLEYRRVVGPTPRGTSMITRVVAAGAAVFFAAAAASMVLRELASEPGAWGDAFGPAVPVAVGGAVLCALVAMGKVRGRR